MTLTVTCDKCGKRYKVDHRFAGRHAKCPACGESFEIPTAAESQASAPARASEATPASRNSSSSPSRSSEAMSPASPPPMPPSPPPPTEGSAPVAVDDSAEYLPWETPPSLLSKVTNYDEHEQYEVFPCKCSEYLNNLNKKETFASMVEGAELRIYPDAIGVMARPGCLAGLVLKLPENVRRALSPFLLPFRLVAASGGLVAILLGLGIMAIIGLAVLYAIITLPLVMIPALVVLAGGRFAYVWWQQRRFEQLVARIRQDPTSPYAIKKLYELTNLWPRYWQAGDLVQLFRVDTRKRLLNNSLILAVQDNSLPARPGFFGSGIGLYIGRWWRPQRRIYAFILEGGKDEADRAARAIAKIMSVEMQRAKFTMGALLPA